MKNDPLGNNLLGALAIGVIIILVNIGGVPDDQGLKILVILVHTIWTSIMVYGIFAMVSIALSSPRFGNQNIIQSVLFFLYVITIYKFNYDICIRDTKPMTFEQEQKQKRETQYNLMRMYENIPQILKQGESYRPGYDKYEADSIIISNYLKAQICIPFEEMDSIQLRLVSKMFGYNYRYQDRHKDCELGTETFGGMCNSIKLRNIFYSPDLELIIPVISYQKMSRWGADDPKFVTGSSISYIGFRSQDSLKFYFHRATHGASNHLTDEKLAYARMIEILLGDKYHTSILSNEYWSPLELRRKTSLESRDYYEFELYKIRNEYFNKPPRFIIKYEI
jgi:hypothetical protein